VNAAIIAALIAATAALITSIVSLISQRRTTALQHKLEMQREAGNRAAQIQQIMTKYRQPLLQAATDLQSRLYSIVRGHLLQVYGRGSADERAYTMESTLFVFGQYFAWVEALRREVQFLDMGVDEQNRQVQDCIERITSEFLRDDLEPEFRLFRGEQRAMGEVMLAPRVEGSGLECIGVASFRRRVNELDVDAWFKKLRQDLDRLTQRSAVSSRRVERIQGALIDLMDCLDPQGVRIPRNRREKLVTLQ
jgi:hypothetical protein